MEVIYSSGTNKPKVGYCVNDNKFFWRIECPTAIGENIKKYKCENGHAVNIENPKEIRIIPTQHIKLDLDNIPLEIIRDNELYLNLISECKFGKDRQIMFPALGALVVARHFNK